MQRLKKQPGLKGTKEVKSAALLRDAVEVEAHRRAHLGVLADLQVQVSREPSSFFLPSSPRETTVIYAWAVSAAPYSATHSRVASEASRK